MVALAILAVQGKGAAGSIVAALAGLAGLVVAVVVFALILRSEPFARSVGLFTERLVSRVRGWFHKAPVQGYDRAVVKFRGRVVEFVRRRWVMIPTIVTVVGHLALYQVLLASLRVMGVSEEDASWAQILAVFAFACLITAILVTPGGVGIVELALISGITAARWGAGRRPWRPCSCSGCSPTWCPSSSVRSPTSTGGATPRGGTRPRRLPTG